MQLFLFSLWLTTIQTWAVAPYLQTDISPFLSALDTPTTYTSVKIEQIKNLYKTKNGQESMSEFLSRLPLSFRALRQEVFDSRSLHCATRLKPRIILFSNEGLFCSFNSGFIEDYVEESKYKDCQQSLNALECLAYDFERHKFIPHSFFFLPEINGTRVKVDKSVHQNLCSGCHFTSGRGISDAYFTWARMYGGSDDAKPIRFLGPIDSVSPASIIDSTEANAFEEYLRSKNSNPRYATLPDFPLGKMGLARRKGVRLNLLASDLIDELNLDRSMN